MSFSPPKPLVLWVKYRDSYVRSVHQLVLRIKNSEKFGENLRGFADGGGELVEIDWAKVVKLKPTAIEINNSKNPFAEFVTALEAADVKQVSEFLDRLSVVSVNMSDISCSDLLRFFRRLTLLEAFAFTDTCFNSDDWSSVATELSRLNLRALDISADVLECLVSKLDVDLLKLSGSPGLSVKSLQETSTEFVTVKTLVAQELNFVSDHDAEDFLSLLPSRFPRLSSLIWDWNMVDPAVIFDERTKNIIQQLIEVFKQLSLGMLVIIAYTPCGETKHATGEIARLLSEKLSGVDVQRFSSKGLETEVPNFSAILVGEDVQARETAEEIIIRGQNSIPSLRHLLPLLSVDRHTANEGPPSIIDFAGFNGDLIRKTFRNKEWGTDLKI